MFKVPVVSTLAVARNMHIAIIGAGASGLVATHRATEPEINFTCEVFEQTGELGGTWVYTDNVGIDEYDIPVHTSMYENLITNVPKEIMNFPDFPFPEYKKSYISQEQVLKYLHEYARHFNLNQYVKYRHLVEKIHPAGDNKWSITTKDLTRNSRSEKLFDAVLICTGHYSNPNLPDLPGADLFQGRQIHSHDYRKPKIFKNQTVLIIGAGTSAIDITHQLLKHNVKIIFSCKKMYLNVTFPSQVVMKPNTVKLSRKCATFEDGSSENIDAVLYCTGYKYNFPFLTKECGITVDDNFVQPLYKHIVNIEHPSMGFIGIQDVSLAFPLFDFQARVYLRYLKGIIQLPCKEKMQLDTDKEMAERWAKGYPKKKAHLFGFDFQESYLASLTALGNIEPLPPVTFKIFADVFAESTKKIIYKIIDSETFAKTTDNKKKK